MTATTTVPTPWTTGDFHIIAKTHIAGDALCEDCDLSAGSRVLDVACGSGNTAFAAARHGAHVTGIDIYDKLIERAKVRAQAEGFEIEFLTADAADLPFADGAFDYVLSTFGVMFAPDQQRAADEMLRVCKPGGTIALSNWTLESFASALFGIGAKYGPPRPQGAHSPIEWGTSAGLRRLFGGRTRSIRLFDRAFRTYTSSFDEWFAIMRTHFGPMKMLFDNLPENHARAAHDELQEIAERYNRSTDGKLSVQMAYVNAIIEL